MEIEFSEHAKQQLTRRRIGQQLVKDVVQNPQKVLPSFRERELFQRRINDRILEVVTKQEGKKVIVITAYYLEEQI